jgi:outer membrane receptor protein involved in Fe transport
VTLPAPYDEQVTYPITYQVAYVEPRLEGRLWNLPGGALSLAVGGQARQEKFEYSQSALIGNLPPKGGTADLSRHVASAYLELMVPIVGKENAIPWAREIRIDLAGRYDHYSDFGSSANPKAGISWAPIDSLKFHGTYAKSFQAPTLHDLSTIGQSAIVSPYADPRSPTGSSLGLYTFIANPSLQPETAKSFDLGLTFEPMFLNGLKVDASYFSIDFNNQIVSLFSEGFCPTLGCSVQEQTELGSNFNANPSQSGLNGLLNNPRIAILNYAGGNFAPAPYSPTDIKAIITMGSVNAASTRVRGIDLTPQYSDIQTSIGKFNVDLDASYFLRYFQAVTTNAPTRSIDNTLFNPLRFRAKANVGWQSKGWAANVRANYANAYSNPGDPSCPGGCPISSWTTVDLAFSYTVPKEFTLLSDARFSLSVSNVFDRKPPAVAYPGFLYGYDPVNASPLLRAIAITFSKRWGR